MLIQLIFYRHILSEIFSGKENEVVVEAIHEYLGELAKKIRTNEFPIHEYTIFTKLGKEPEEYPQGKTMPHVQVALRKKGRGEPVKVGDVIPYIVTGYEEGISSNPAERAYTPQDVLKDPELKPGKSLFVTGLYKRLLLTNIQTFKIIRS